MAIASPILRKVTTSANIVKKRISDTRDSFKTIGQILFRKTKVKREAFAQTNLFRKRREETERRQQLESELEAPNVVSRPGGAQQLIQNTGVGGFFDRILGFIGYLAAGWIMSNLPTWIAIGKEFIARIQKAGQILSGFFNNTLKLFVGVGNILGALGQNLLQFDFFDTSNRLKNSMVDLNNTMGTLTGQIEEAFGLVTTPLTQGKYSGQDIPGVGTQYQDEGAYEEPPPYTGGAAVLNMRQLVGLALKVGFKGNNAIVAAAVARAESGGNTQAHNKKPPDNSYGLWQINMYGSLGEPRRREFNIQTNAELFDPIVNAKAAYKISGGSNFGPWAVYRSGAYKQFLAEAERALYRPQELPKGTIPSQLELPPLPPTDTLPGGVQRYGASRDKGARKHAGVDFDISGPNAKFYSRIGGVVVGSPFRYGDDGWAIDIYNEQLGVYERIAEASKVLVKRGQSISPGQAVVQGESGTGVIHYEIRRNVSGGFENTVDPIAFLKSAPTRNQIAQVPAQFSAPSQQMSMVPYTITPDRRGQDIMIMQPDQQQNIITPVSGGGDGPAPSAISDFQLLNNFIKNKLLLDLAYL